MPTKTIEDVKVTINAINNHDNNELKIVYLICLLVKRSVKSDKAPNTFTVYAEKEVNLLIL